MGGRVLPFDEVNGDEIRRGDDSREVDSIIPKAGILGDVCIAREGMEHAIVPFHPFHEMTTPLLFLSTRGHCVDLAAEGVQRGLRVTYFRFSAREKEKG